MNDRSSKKAGGGSPTLNMHRRQFLKCSALAGGALAASGAIPSLMNREISAQSVEKKSSAYTHLVPENQLYTVCQQCNTNCGIKVKIVDGRVEKIDGSPFNPWTLSPHLAYKTSMTDAARVEGAICPKGQAGIQTLYDPYRIVKVLEAGRQAR